MPITSATIVETGRSVQSIEQAFPLVAEEHHLKVLSVRHIKEEMARQGSPYERTCVVFEVCCPSQAAVVLSRHPEVATAIPCRVSVYEEDGRTKIAVLNPSSVLNLFGIPGLAPMAEKFEENLFAVIETLAQEKTPLGPFT